MKKITIGVPTYHAHSTLPKLLSSLQTQTMSEDIAIILADKKVNLHVMEEVLKSLILLMKGQLE